MQNVASIKSHPKTGIPWESPDIHSNEMLWHVRKGSMTDIQLPPKFQKNIAQTSIPVKFYSMYVKEALSKSNCHHNFRKKYCTDLNSNEILRHAKKRRVTEIQLPP